MTCRLYFPPQIAITPQTAAGNTVTYFSGFSNSIATTGQAQALMRKNVLNLRNLFRYGWGDSDVINLPLPSERYVVSDIARYSGTANTETEYYFVIEDKTKGCQWLIVTHGPITANNVGGTTSSGWGAAAANRAGLTQDKHLAPHTAQSISDRSFWFGFAPDKADWNFNTVMGFDNTTTLTFTGGDFTTVATAPSNATNLQSWHYNANLKSFPCARETGNATVSGGHRVCFGIDEETGSMFVLDCNTFVNDNNRIPHAFVIHSTDLFISNEDEDDYPYGSVWGLIALANTGTPSGIYGSISGINQAATPTTGAQGYTSEGTYIYNYGLMYTDNFEHTNFLDDDDKYKWRYIAAVSPDDDKGVFNPKVIRHIGTRYTIETAGAHFDDDGQHMMCFGNFAIPWAEGVPLPFFPFEGMGSFLHVSIDPPP